ncbi:MAG: cation diffusion facilitator family transporter [Promethearchaeota archaeon]
MVHPHRPYIGDSLDQFLEYKTSDKQKLIYSMIITGSIMVVEVIGGILANSLALLSDAGHMFTHFFALLISYIAIIIASKEPCHHRTFGLYRAEILAALFNSIFLFGVTGYILYKGIQRLIQPEPILGFEMLLISIVGLIVNIITVLILHGSAREDINVKGAYLHMIGDTASSIVIIIGALILIFTNWYFLDPILAIGISIVIFVWAARLFRDSINILLETTPKGLNIDIVSTELKSEISEIKEIYDMHIWVITSNMYSFTAQIAINKADYEKSQEILNKIKMILNEKYRIVHSTIEFAIE